MLHIVSLYIIFIRLEKKINNQLRSNDTPEQHAEA